MILSTPTYDGSAPKKKNQRPDLAKPVCCDQGRTFGAFVLLSLTLLCGQAHAAANDVRVVTALNGADSGVRETNAGDLAADAVASAAATQIAFVPADELTSVIIAVGSVDPDDIVKILSYYDDTTDTVQVLNLTGEQIQQTVARSVSRLPQSYPGFIQVSGVKVDATKDGVTVALADGKPLDLTATYKVAMTAPLAAGELGYFNVWGSQAKPKDTGISMAQALRTYVIANHLITGILNNRITEH